ncbi:MAG: hypothetical protein KIT22_15305, partial [Verrucomicrobiae bacterium]|nr:hypothetical protein [Verrucomicrobiae bacterium]
MSRTSASLPGDQSPVLADNQDLPLAGDETGYALINSADAAGVLPEEISGDGLDLAGRGTGRESWDGRHESPAASAPLPPAPLPLAPPSGKSTRQWQEAHQRQELVTAYRQLIATGLTKPQAVESLRAAGFVRSRSTLDRYLAAYEAQGFAGLFDNHE